MKKAEKAKANLLDDIPNANVEIGTLDLGDLQSVKKFAADFLEKNERLDSLILNAGLVKAPYWLSEQGLEMQFAVNHLGKSLRTWRADCGTRWEVFLASHKLFLYFFH